MRKKHMFRAILGVFFLVFTSSVFASEAALTRFFEQVKTMQADFKQSVVDEQGSVIEKTAGRLSLSRPGKFRWDYEAEVFDGSEPSEERGQQIIADGTSIFIYDPEMEQATQKSLQNALSQVPSLSLVESSDNVYKYFSVTDYGLTDGETWVALKPKEADAAFQQLMIGFKADEIRSILLVDGLGNETRLTLSNIVQNKAIAPGVFNFVPQEGVDLLIE